MSHEGCRPAMSAALIPCTTGESPLSQHTPAYAHAIMSLRTHFLARTQLLLRHPPSPPPPPLLVRSLHLHRL